jgi:hypothetical protein
MHVVGKGTKGNARVLLKMKLLDLITPFFEKELDLITESGKEF